MIFSMMCSNKSFQLITANCDRLRAASLLAVTDIHVISVVQTSFCLFSSAIRAPPKVVPGTRFVSAQPVLSRVGRASARAWNQCKPATSGIFSGIVTMPCSNSATLVGQGSMKRNLMNFLTSAWRSPRNNRLSSNTSPRHLIESAQTTFHAALLLMRKKRDILNTQVCPIGR